MGSVSGAQHRSHRARACPVLGRPAWPAARCARVPGLRTRRGPACTQATAFKRGHCRARRPGAGPWWPGPTPVGARFRGNARGRVSASRFSLGRGPVGRGPVGRGPCAGLCARSPGARALGTFAPCTPQLSDCSLASVDPCCSQRARARGGGGPAHRDHARSTGCPARPPGRAQKIHADGAACKEVLPAARLTEFTDAGLLYQDPAIDQG